MIELPITISNLDRIAAALEKLVQIHSAARFTFKLKTGVDMNYKADRPDFDFQVTITATDSEGNVINDAPIPAGHTLSITSDNPAAFEVAQDATDPRIVHAHVGSPGQANVMANLFDPANNLIATGA